MAQFHKKLFPSIPPTLQEASELVLAVIDASEKTRQNKVGFHRLANNTSDFVDDMIDYYQIMGQYFLHGVPEEFAVVFQRTVNELKFLRTFVRQAASRNILMAFIFSRSDAREIKSHDLTLAMSKEMFKMISNAYVKSFVPKLSAETLEALKQRFAVVEAQSEICGKMSIPRE